MNFHHFLAQHSMAAKLRLLAAVSTVLLVLTSAYLLWADYQLRQRGHETTVQHTVETIHSLLDWVHESEKKGVYTRAQAQQLALQMVKKARYSGNEYFWLQDVNARVVMHPIKPELDGQDGSSIKDPDGQALFVVFGQVARQQGAGLVQYQWPKPGSAEPEPKISYVKLFEPWGWVIGSGVYADDIRDEFMDSAMSTLLIVAVVLAINLALSQSVSRSIVDGLRKAMRVAHAISQRDLTQQITVKGKDEISELLAAMKTMSGDLQGTLTTVRDAAEQLARTSNEIAQGNVDLSARTEQTAANLEETAASMEQITSSVQSNLGVAQQAASSSSHASQVATEAGASVGRVVATMDGITAASRRISDIIAVIDGIAFQTNILALNAAVEAARAGEQGRGFAVVATEVRTLAQRSAQAAQEIKVLIESSAQQVEVGAQEVHQARNTMDRVVRSVQEVSALIGEISSSVDEQSSGIVQINAAMANLDQMTQQNAALVEESGAAATSLREQAFVLKDSVNRFKLA